MTDENGTTVGLSVIAHDITERRKEQRALEASQRLLAEAQRIFAEAGRISARRDVRPRYPEIDIEARKVKILLLTPDDAVQYEKPYQQLREEFLLNR